MLSPPYIRRWVLLLALFALAGTTASAQNDFVCGTETDPGGGPRIGPFGTHRALVVLVRFRDDLTEGADLEQYWAADDEEAPPFAYGMLDIDSTESSFRDSTLTSYYYQQSLQSNGDCLIIYGTVYPDVIETQFDEIDYYRYDITNCTTCGVTPRRSGRRRMRRPPPGGSPRHVASLAPGVHMVRVYMVRVVVDDRQALTRRVTVIR
jgi:hypothetical protein